MVFYAPLMPITAVRELLDGQRAKFQEEFRAIEVDLQQSERDLLAKRELMAKDEYDRLVTAFQARVSSVQKEIQYKRQSIDNAYQKALSDIRGAGDRSDDKDCQ